MVERASDCCAVATFGTQLSNNLSASEVNALVNGSATQSQLDLFASRAGEPLAWHQCSYSLDSQLPIACTCVLKIVPVSWPLGL